MIRATIKKVGLEKSFEPRSDCMPSIRTEYRVKRITLIKESINLLMDMLTLEKQELEKIPLSFFKGIKRGLEKRQKESKV